MYGIKQAPRLDFDTLLKLLAPHGYLYAQESPGLWKQQTRCMVFTLCVCDLGIKSNSLDGAHHLINAIKNISNPQSVVKVKITSV